MSAFNSRWTYIASVYYKNIKHMLETNYRFGEVYRLASQIEHSDDRVAFKKVFSNNNGEVALLAFKAGQKLDTHSVNQQVMVNIIEGEIEFTMLDTPHKMKAGDFLLMGEGVPHSVVATTDAKVMLVRIKA